MKKNNTKSIFFSFCVIFIFIINLRRLNYLININIKNTTLQKSNNTKSINKILLTSKLASSAIDVKQKCVELENTQKSFF